MRFLLSSGIAVIVGGAVSWYAYGIIHIQDMFLTAAGVLLLHASVDLLNDYRDYRRGIDTQTIRTGMSGGTGVLPEGLLEPESVRRAGTVCLIIGSSIGIYYIYTHGIIIAAILGFAVLSIYFYSTRIVDAGLGEVFVGIKGSMIVLGTSYIQADTIGSEAALLGAAMGALSALVLFVVSFPDHDADKSGGRRTLVILLGRCRAATLYWVFPGAFCGVILCGVISGILPPLCVSSLAALPLAILSGKSLSHHHSGPIHPYMRNTILYSRTSGIILAAALFISATAVAS